MTMPSVLKVETELERGSFKRGSLSGNFKHIGIARLCSILFGSITSMFGIFVLAGFFLHNPMLRNPTPWGNFTGFNSGLCLTFTGFAILICNSKRTWRKSFVVVCGLLISVIAAISVCEWAFGWDAGFDQLLMRENEIRYNAVPGRMALGSAISFLLLGTSLTCFSIGRVNASQLLSWLAMVIGLLTLSGHSYGIRELVAFGTGNEIAFPLSIGIILAGAAVIVLDPTIGEARVIVSTSMGGRVARMLLPMILFVPVLGILTGVGRLVPEKDLLYLTTFATVLFPTAIWLVADAMDRLDRQKDQALDNAFARKEELEQLNRELQDSRDEALQASHLKTAFVAAMSHELRTPLSGIIGANDLLLTHPGLDEESRELVKSAQGSAQALYVLVNDLLDISKIESGKFPMDQVPFNPAELVEESVRVCATAAQCKGLRLNTYIDPAIPDHVLGDPDRLRQVLLNLINNGIKFTQDGYVSVEVTCQPQENGEKVSLTFSVKDTGIGISAEGQKLLFKPFSQIDNSATRKFGGAGLGLALSKGLVELMGGTVGVQSIKGEGSNFWFKIPFQLSAVPRVATEVMEPSVLSLCGLEDKLVLVVEDTLVVQKIVVKQLLSMGLRVHAVSTGQEALDLLTSGEFDLVLMDCNLPDISGLDVTREVRKFEEGSLRHVLVVAMTAAAMKGDAERCMAAGMDDYLSKPVRITQLHQMLVKWFKTGDAQTFNVA